MKNFAIILVFLLAGCTKIETRSTIGSALPEDDSSKFEGTWYGFSNSEHLVSYNPSNDTFTVVYEEDGEKKKGDFKLTAFDDETLILWFYDTDESGYLPVRVLPSFDESGEAFMSILLPDSREIERLVEEGSIVLVSKTKDAWVLEEDGLERHLRSKGMWDLGNVVHLHKRMANRTAPASALP